MILGANSASNKRNAEMYQLSQLKVMDCIWKLYVFLKEKRFSLIFGTCPICMACIFRNAIR